MPIQLRRKEFFMKNILKSILMFFGMIAFAAPVLPYKEFKANAAPETFKAGAPVKISVTAVPAEGFSFKAYRLFCYQPNVPTAFFERPGMKITKAKEKKFTSAEIRSWTWLRKELPDHTLSFELNTKDWPEGDYCIAVQGIFGGPGKKDLYRATELTFSIVK